MQGNLLRITMLDGVVHEAVVTWGVACRWEDQHPLTTIAKFEKEPTHKQAAWFAWDALRTAKIVVKVFPQFLDELGEIEVVPKDKTGL